VNEINIGGEVGGNFVVGDGNTVGRYQQARASGRTGFKMTSVGIEIGNIAGYCNMHKMHLQGEMTLFNENTTALPFDEKTKPSPIWSPDTSDMYCPSGSTEEVENHVCSQFWVVVTA